MSMMRTSKYLPKDVHKLNSKQLAEVLFPKKALDQIEAELREKPKRKSRKKS
jgi:hypothetical protein